MQHKPLLVKLPRDGEEDVSIYMQEDVCTQDEDCLLHGVCLFVRPTFQGDPSIVVAQDSAQVPVTSPT